MSLEEDLAEHSKRVAAGLSALLDLVGQRGMEYHPFIGRTYESIRAFCLRGGQRIASYTTYLVARGYDYAEAECIEAACEAVELYRHSILVHDDLVDGDELRRGEPTLHREYSGLRDDRLGLGVAVFVGNILFSLALRRIMESNVAPGIRASIAGEILVASNEVNESQVLDLHMEGTLVDPGEWEVMASKRAASLFGTTLKMGALLAGERRDLELLGRAGEEMGYVFDIQDDIIDTYAVRSEYGRNPGSDLKTRKRPLHILLAGQRAKEGEALALRDPDLGLDEVKRILSETGAVGDAKRMADQHATNALQIIQSTSLSEESKAMFDSLMAYMQESLKWYAP